MSSYIKQIQSDLYYLCMFGCRIFCIAKAIGVDEEKLISMRHLLIERGAIDSEYELLDIDLFIRMLIGENPYKIYSYVLDDDEIDDNNMIHLHDENIHIGTLVGILKKYSTSTSKDYKYHWVLQYNDNTEYNTVTNCTAMKEGRIDKKSVLLIYKNN